MSKKRQQQKPVEQKPDPPKPRGFVPRPCSQCTALRPPNTSYSRVYSKHGQIRYCKCEFCGATWSQYFDIIAMDVASTNVSVVQSETVSVQLGHGISGIVTCTD